MAASATLTLVFETEGSLQIDVDRPRQEAGLGTVQAGPEAFSSVISQLVKSASETFE